MGLLDGSLLGIGVGLVIPRRVLWSHEHRIAGTLHEPDSWVEGLLRELIDEAVGDRHLSSLASSTGPGPEGLERGCDRARFRRASQLRVCDRTPYLRTLGFGASVAALMREPCERSFLRCRHDKSHEAQPDMTPFAERLHAGFQDLKASVGHEMPFDLAPNEIALSGRTWDAIAHLPRQSFNSVELDAVYASVVRSYQKGPRAVWAPLLLEMLAPALSERAGSLFSSVPDVSANDIEQQLVLEVLRWAGTLTAAADLRFVDGRIVRVASRRVSRWLKRMSRRHPEGLEQHPGIAYIDRADELSELNELCGPGISRADLVLIYRCDVWGEPLERLALEQGVSVNAMFCRVRRTRDRLRTRLGAGSNEEQAAAA
jgi:hypothetical protein